MVSDVVQLVRRDQSPFEQISQVRFCIYRVLPGQANQVIRSRQPVIRCELILLIESNGGSILGLGALALAVVLLELASVIFLMLE